MPTRTARRLIAAALGLADHSDDRDFRAHVPGMTDGTHVSDYYMTGWGTLTGTPNPVGGEVTYLHGHVFNMGISFDEASKAGLVRRLGNVLAISADIVNSPSGFGLTNVSSNVVNTPTGSTASCQVVAPYAPNTGVVFTETWFASWTCQQYGDQNGDFSPCEFGTDVPQTCDCIDVEFRASVSSGQPGSAVECAFYLGYTPHTSDWNDDLPTLRFPFYVMERSTADISNYEFEWHNNSTYTSLHTTGRSAIVSGVCPWTTHSLWLRYRLVGGSTWTTHGQVSFTDNWRTFC